MKELEITEGNKLIAKFIPKLIIWSGGDPVAIEDWREPATLKFHSSWDWLVPVIHKCISLDRDSEYGFYDPLYDSLFNLEYIWKACVEFIKWYNEKNS